MHDAAEAKRGRRIDGVRPWQEWGSLEFGDKWRDPHSYHVTATFPHLFLQGKSWPSRYNIATGESEIH